MLPFLLLLLPLLVNIIFIQPINKILLLTTIQLASIDKLVSPSLPLHRAAKLVARFIDGLIDRAS